MEATEEIRKMPPTTVGCKRTIRIYEEMKTKAGEYLELPAINDLIENGLGDYIGIKKSLAREIAFRCGLPLDPIFQR